VLVGVAAAGIGNTCVVAVRTASRMRRAGPWLVTIAVFVAVGLLHWPMLPVMLTMAPVSILLAWREERARGEPDHAV
jgi:chromate transporter